MSFTVITGPCVIEDEGLVLEIAQEVKKQLEPQGVDLYFKASFDKANRSSMESFRGPGLEKGLKTLDKVKQKTGLKLLIDYHLPEQAAPTAEVADYLQIPAFLCRQTDMIRAGVEVAQKQGIRLNVKKGQFLAPWDTKNIVEKATAVAGGPVGDWFTITERGASFGYNRLVVDMIAFQAIRETGVSAIYDATHSIQLPGGAPGGKSTGGERKYLESLARGAMAAGAQGLFLEVHPKPSTAKSDGANAFYLEHLGKFVNQCLQIRNLASDLPKLLPEAR